MLTRAVRFWINPVGSSIGENSFAGKPTISGFGQYHEIDLSIKGYPDPQTGYLLGIQHLDALVRQHLYPTIAQQVASNPTPHPALILPSLWTTANQHLTPTLETLRWRFSPYYSLELSSTEFPMNAVLVRERFEFAAAHRLHSPAMNDAQNAEFFGKCNNPHGHGHNYQLEPCIRIPIDLLKNRSFQSDIHLAVNSRLIEPLDHKFLNIDCPWFDQSLGGVIPSVENIARICYQQLAPAIAELGPGIELVSMTAWETEKTSSIYPA